MASYNTEFFYPIDESEIYNFWLYFDDNEQYGVRVVGILSDALTKAYSLLNNLKNINKITVYNDKLDNFSANITR